MDNLNSIQRTITFLSIGIFVMSFITIFLISIGSNNAIPVLEEVTIENKPVKVKYIISNLTEEYGFNESITTIDEVLIESANGRIVANNLEINFSDNGFRLNGAAYVEVENEQLLSINSYKFVLGVGKYLINTNPININVLLGKVSIENITASSGQSLNLEVDNFKIYQSELDKYFNDKKFEDIYATVQKFNIEAVEINDLFKNRSNQINLIPVSKEEDLDINSPIDSVCLESSLLNIQILCNINSIRESKKLNPLIINEELNQIAFSHVIWMVSNNSTSSIDSSGLSFKERCSKNSINCLEEINVKLASNYNINSVMKELGNNNQILNRDALEVGMAIAGGYLSILVR